MHYGGLGSFLLAFLLLHDGADYIADHQANQADHNQPPPGPAGSLTAAAVFRAIALLGTGLLGLLTMLKEQGEDAVFRYIRTEVLKKEKQS